MTGDRSSGDRVVREAERLRRLVVATAADLIAMADRLQAEAKLLRGEAGGEEGDDGRGPEV